MCKFRLCKFYSYNKSNFGSPSLCICQSCTYLQWKFFFTDLYRRNIRLFGCMHWYSGICGGTPISTETSLIQNPTATTVYYIRVEGVCNTTACVSVTISIIQNSVQPSSASAYHATTCVGTADSLYTSGGTLSIRCCFTGMYYYYFPCVRHTFSILESRFHA